MISYVSRMRVFKNEQKNRPRVQIEQKNRPHVHRPRVHVFAVAFSIIFGKENEKAIESFGEIWYTSSYGQV